MKILYIILLISVLLSSACTRKPLPPVPMKLPDHQVNYLSEIKPILDKRCAVCHSCYNSPCQLKLSSFEGVDRGGSKEAIYHASRLQIMEPSRLFIDAANTDQWRKKGFHNVTRNTAAEGFNNSIMLQILSHKMEHPKSSGDYFSEADDLTCSASRVELGKYLDKHPNNGMPFGFPPLKQDEFELIGGWLAQGAMGPGPVEQKRITTPVTADRNQIDKWEQFLNNPDPKYGMTARYLFEHLFLAHIKFTDSGDFYEMLRSKTPPEKPIEIIGTIRPYDAPGVDRFYYRFRKIHSTIVHKTHMVFTLDDAKMDRFKELFIEPEWLQKPHLMAYDKIESANPFILFEQIPPRSRYQFLLDNSHYILMTFIRGPVCRGQIALDSIRDHFWVMFQDPDHDLSVLYPGFLKFQQKNLRMPIEKGSDFPLLDLVNNDYQKAAKKYYRARQNFYTQLNYRGQGYDAVWKGNRAEDAPLLTVYRHFDSASVHKGIKGELPKTIWVIDYPLLERIYYSLVAGFDVYGTAGHQLAERLYMDRLRKEGESYFLAFLPKDIRQAKVAYWNLHVDPKDVDYYDGGIATAIDYKTEDPQREFIEELVTSYIPENINIDFDPINYLAADQSYPSLPKQYETPADYFQAFRAISKPGTKFFSFFNSYNANIVYVRIRKNDGTNALLSIVINRWHDNVDFLFDEKKTLHPEKDQANILQGFVGSYPNYFVDIKQDDLPDFFDLMENLDSMDIDEARDRFNRYGVNRSNENFWVHYDWFQNRFKEEQPVTSGLFDLNRYFYRAR